MCCVIGYTGHDMSADKFKEYLMRTVSRGPDDQRVVEGPFGLMGFGRLAIMGLTPEGMQPFYRGADCVVCNGELYGFRFEKEILKRRGYKFTSDCDCEILLPLYYEYGLDMFRHMDAEFALILYDSRKDRLIAARDPIGIRPLFYGYSKSSHKIAFASEMQNLIGWCDDIRPFPIGSYYCDGRFVRYEDIADVPAPMQDDMDTILAARVPELDLIIGGHTHTVLPEGLRYGSTLVTQTGKSLKNVGITEITVKGDKILSMRNHLCALDTVTPSPEYAALVAAYNADPQLNRSVGCCADSLDKTGVAEFMTSVMRLRTGADLACYHYGGVRVEGLAAGGVSMADIFAIEPFASTVCLVDMTEEELRQMIINKFNNSANPKEAHRPDIHPNGMSYTILTDERGEATDVRFRFERRKPVYRVAMPDYMFKVYEFAKSGNPLCSDLLMTDIMTDYVRNSSPVRFDNTPKVEIAARAQ